VTLRVLQFGDFHLDCAGFELRRGERSLKLERKPMELLILLATRSGELVTRDEIAERLWDREVFVDTEHGINTAVRKIRVVLRDDREEPRFVQTVTGKGYRFIGPIVPADSPGRKEAPQVLPESVHADMNAIAAPGPPGSVPIPGPASHSEVSSNGNANGSRKGIPLIWLSAFGVLAVLSVILVVVPQGRSWENPVLYSATSPAIRSLAVLPLDNLSSQPGQDYLVDGMTDELITMLAKDSTLRVISRRSVMQYKGVQRPMPEIAQELGVDGVLEGSVARLGDNVHMTVQLVQASSDTDLWAESYDRDANDLVSLPGEAAQTIAKRLNSAALHVYPTRFVSPEAHDAYLHGRYLWFRRENDKASEYFKRAIELQPDYAAAWSGLSNCYGGSAIMGIVNPEDSLPPQEAAATKALAQDDSLAEAHLAMAAVMFLRWNWPGAEQEIVRATELDPGFAEAYHLRAIMLAALQRQREALEAQKKASELDPFARPGALAYSLMLAKQYDAALTEVRLNLQGNSQDPALRRTVYEIYRRYGMEKEAGETLEQILLASSDNVSAARVRQAYRNGGYRALIRWQLSDAKARSSTHYVSPYHLAQFQAQLGHRSEALALLEAAYRQHAPPLLWVQTDPAFDFLHPDERYRSIIRRIGLPPAY
jgi:TolB-like protein/DNA-binding winged helix-turn-helix (wHTH) protein